MRGSGTWHGHVTWGVPEHGTWHVTWGVDSVVASGGLTVRLRPPSDRSWPHAALMLGISEKLSSSWACRSMPAGSSRGLPAAAGAAGGAGTGGWLVMVLRGAARTEAPRCDRKLQESPISA